MTTTAVSVPAGFLCGVLDTLLSGRRAGEAVIWCAIVSGAAVATGL
jgi:hypothetical protein